MGFLSVVILTVAISYANSQYGPVKGPAIRRTTTPFPPGFQSDNQIYNPESNSVAPEPNSFQSGALSGSYARPNSGSPNPYFYGGEKNPNPSSGYGAAPSSNQKTPAGAVSQLDNPWLSGIVSQNSGPSKAISSSGSCGYGGCSSSSSSAPTSFQSTTPTVPCTTPGYVCVQKYQCQGGVTSAGGNGVSFFFMSSE